MAEAVKIKIGHFKWNRGGYKELMDSEAVQSLIRAPMENAARQCGSGYISKRIRGRLASGYVVKPEDDATYAQELRENNLLRAFSSIRI